MKQTDIDQAQAFIDGNYYKIGLHERIYCWHPIEGWIRAKQRKDESITEEKMKEAIRNQIKRGYKYSLKN